MADPLAILQRVRSSVSERPEPGERCDLCGEAIGHEHDHLVDLKDRQILCACHGCHLLFTADGAGGGHFLAIPDSYRSIPGGLDASEWDTLQIPVGVAFFFVNSSLARVAAFYPGPAGATESLLSLDTWNDLVGDHPLLGDVRPDVEALLVRLRADGSGGADGFIVPIDACYELAGTLRLLWRGFDGGTDARRAIDEFFDGVRERSR